MPDFKDMAISFEAVKTSISQSKTGIILRLAIHPEDMPVDLLKSWPGTRYGVAMVQLSDTDEPTVSDKTLTAIRAIKSAAMLCREDKFYQFLRYKKVVPFRVSVDEQVKLSTEFMRQHIGVKSRAEMKENEEALQKFLDLRDEFHEWYKR